MTDNRLGAAYHEAGHGVLAHLLGLEVAEITINGHEGAGNTVVVDAAVRLLSPLDQLAMCLAGQAAQEIFEFQTHDLAAASDYAKIIEILGYEISEERSGELRDSAYRRAFELLLVNRTMVTLVARRLAENERICGAEFLDPMKLS